MELVLYDSMCRAIDACYEVDEVKDIRDKAKAMAEYLRQAKNREAERRCSEVRLRAEIKAGGLLKQQAERGERATQAQGRPPKASNDTRLSDFGVSYDQSSRWQQMSDIRSSREVPNKGRISQVGENVQQRNLYC